MSGRSAPGRRIHLLPLAVFAALAIIWTCPLILHLGTHVPGAPGDNFSFVWNLWWMRQALQRSDLAFFHSSYLFHPFGVDLVNHPHTALQGVLSATVLRPLTFVEAQNVNVLAALFANALATYALIYDITQRQRAATLGAVIFAGSPYISAHLLGHFDLLHAWVLPLFALCLRRALIDGRLTWMAGCGLALSAAAYAVYYYVVYIGLFAAAYLIARANAFRLEIERRAPSTRARIVRVALTGLLVADIGLMFWIARSGGGVISTPGEDISVRSIQNPLTAGWLLTALLTWSWWRVRLQWHRPPPEFTRRFVLTAACTVVVFGLCAAPLIFEAVAVIADGRYVSQTYYWRSAPPGIDVLALVAGNPFHPLTREFVTTIYQKVQIHLFEGAAWLGIVPLALLLAGRGGWSSRDEARCWLAVLAVALVWALGPRLIVVGFDVGLPLPQSLVRFVPIVSNARVPARAIVLVYLALGLLAALRLDALPERWRRVPVQWGIIVLAAVDFLSAPIALTALQPPAVYQRLAAQRDDLPVCEVPFGIGDGLSGVGSQARETLYYATVHGHPVVGGYIGRMPPGTEDRYLEMPLVGNLLRLSTGQAPVLEPALPTPVPCGYLAVNRVTTPAATLTYLTSSLDLELLADDEGRALYAVRGTQPSAAR